jgi:hypothetical protein
MTETQFNISDEVRNAGYELADKDFSILRTLSSTPIETWDLKKGQRVYALKFATAQKLNYVVDQAMSVLELLRNKANVNEIPDFKEYCLWLEYRLIILKQKIEPVIKISRKLKEGIPAMVNG